MRRLRLSWAGASCNRSLEPSLPQAPILSRQEGSRSRATRAAVPAGPCALCPTGCLCPMPLPLPLPFAPTPTSRQDSKIWTQDSINHPSIHRTRSGTNAERYDTTRLQRPTPAVSLRSLLFDSSWKPWLLLYCICHKVRVAQRLPSPRPIRCHACLLLPPPPRP